MDFDFSDNQEAQDLIHLINFSNENVFLTGRAGTGKSTLLRGLIKNLQKNYVILAPTGNTALNVSGKTIHSFFQFAPIPILPNTPVNYEYKDEKRQLIKNLEVLIIDEISMVRADIIDAIDKTLRYYKNPSLAFGGIQVLFVGDSFQLPPVIPNNEWVILKDFYSSLFFFDARVFKKHQLLTIELLKVYRQQEQDFLTILDSIRLNNLNSEHLKLLNTRVLAPKKGFETILTIATKKERVEFINKQQLQKNTSPSKFYEGITTGVFNQKPALQSLELKVGAQIIMIKNDARQRWVNGSMGAILDLADDVITVCLDSLETVTVERETWYNVEFCYNSVKKCVTTYEIGKFTQFPIALCWAMTIHKSQGLTFDNIEVDLGDGVWDSGQTYVALSRCRSFHGLYLTRPVKMNDIKLDSTIIEFSNGFNNEAVYKSSYKAKQANKEFLLAEIEENKLSNNYLNIITNASSILKLSVNLIESFHLLALKAYCYLRISNYELANQTIVELEKYETLKKTIGPLTYDSIFSLLHGTELLGDPETRKRGFQKIDMILTRSMPDTLSVLHKLVFDRDLIYKEYN